MKSKLYLISLLTILPLVKILACGPFDSLESNPISFKFPEKDEPESCVGDENVVLWKKLTSPSIPDKDVDEAVYEFTYTQLKNAFNAKGEGRRNSFVRWIIHHNATDLRDFLLLAKEVEEMRDNRISPWYYPSDAAGFDASADERVRYDDILERCRRHQTGRLADRYALQAIRLLFSFGEYNKLIGYYRATLQPLPDSNWLKFKAKGYYAGALYRLGHIDEANVIYLETYDIWSIHGSDRYAQIAAKYPESQRLKSRLNELIGYDTFGKVDSIADAALNSKNVINRGDWLYLKAYCQAIYKDNYENARRLIRKARKARFSDRQLAEDARFFEICVRAKCGDIRGYERDALWMLRERKQRNGLWFFIIPEMLRQGLTNEALLLANYDTNPSLPKDKILWDNERYYGCVKEVGPMSIANLYATTEKYYADISYSNTGFQMLQSLGSADVISYRKYLKDTPSLLAKELKPRVRFDDEYFDELIGTLLLREGDYAKAAKYLSRVSHKFQKEMNIYGFLEYDPWQYYVILIDEWNTVYSPTYRKYYRENDNYRYDMEDDIDSEEDFRYKFWFAQPLEMPTAKNAKYNFARKMARLQWDMKHNPSKDQRAMARLRYAIGRFNSFWSCWALTQYWDGNADHQNYQYFYRHHGDYVTLDQFLREWPKEREYSIGLFFREMKESIRQIKDPETMAEAQLMLHNYRTIARRYPTTLTGRHLAAHCDHWKDWI